MADDNARLSPAVQRAFDYHIGRLEARVKIPPPPPPENPFSKGGLTRENYAKSVRDDIDATYAASRSTRESLRLDLREQAFPGLSEDDLDAAVELFDAVMVATLMEENATGGGKEAIEKVKESFPHLPEKLYADMMGFAEYRNR